MDAPIASAVVLPEDPLPPASSVHKRRQSSVSEQSAKRARLDNCGAPSGRRDSTTETTPDVPKRRERGRERRLFGAVLGALSQNPSTTAAQKRRSDIERRQLAQRRHDDEEGEQRKAERGAARKVQRWKEQRSFERESMRLRHENLLHTAHFLRTDSTPHLYYRPWETTIEEDYLIKNQIAAARDVIKQEIEEHEARQEEVDRKKHASQDVDASRDAEVSHIGKEETANAPQQSSAANGTTNGAHDSPKDQDMNYEENPGHEAVRAQDATEDESASTVANQNTSANDPSKDIADENGEDVIEEAAEDTVIY